MKRKATVGIIAIIILICSIVIFRSIYIQRSYYPMGGEVTILAKQADNYGYYITVEQGKPDDAGWGQFELKCTQEQYEAVDVGDVVKCDREQSIVTNSGTVHKIQKRYPDVMSIDEMCRALSIGKKTGYKLLQTGQIRFLKIGRAYLIPKINLLEYLQVIRPE